MSTGRIKHSKHGLVAELDAEGYIAANTKAFRYRNLDPRVAPLHQVADIAPHEQASGIDFRRRLCQSKLEGRAISGLLAGETFYAHA